MDSLKSLMEKKEFDLVIQITENARDATDLFYRITALLATNRADDALHCIKVNRRLLEKCDLALLIKMHIEILCVLQRFDDAYSEMDYYDNLPYESQIVEESLKHYRKYIRETERQSFSTKTLTNDEVLKALKSNESALVLDALQMVRTLDLQLFMPSIENILVNFNSQSVRSFALMVLVDKKVNKILNFKSVDGVIEVNPSLLTPPFVDEKFGNFLKTLYSDLRNPSLAMYAEHIFSGYIIYTYPNTCTFNEAVVLCALYGLALEYAQASTENDTDLTFEEKCAEKGVAMEEAQKLIDLFRESIEIF